MAGHPDMLLVGISYKTEVAKFLQTLKRTPKTAGEINFVFFNCIFSVWPEIPFSSLCQKKYRSCTPVNLAIVFLARLETEFFHPNS